MYEVAYKSLDNLIGHIYYINSPDRLKAPDKGEVVPISILHQQDMVKSFYLECLAKNLRPSSIKCYLDRLKYLFDALSTLGIAVDELTPDACRDIIISYLKSELSPATVNGRIRVFRLFYKYLLREKFIKSSPFERIKLVKYDQKIKPIISPEQMKLLLGSFNTEKFQGIRNRCMILVFYDTMIRVGELTSIQAGDVDLAGGTIRIHHTKSRRDRFVPISRRTAQQLHSYIIKHHRLIDSDFLFCLNTGFPLTKERVYKILRRKGKQLDLMNLYPHLIRHSGATQYIRQGGSVNILQRILGHADIRTTQIYCHSDDQDMLKNHEQFSPVGALTG